MTVKVLVNDAPGMRALMANLRPGDRVAFTGTGVAVELVGKSGRTALLRILAPETVRIERSSPLVGSDTSMAACSSQSQRNGCVELVAGA